MSVGTLGERQRLCLDWREAATLGWAVHRREACALFGRRCPEHRVCHPKRTEDALLEEGLEGCARPDFHQPPQHGRSLAVPIARARVFHQGYADQIRDELRHRDRPRPHLFATINLRGPGVQPRGVKQKVTHGDGFRRRAWCRSRRVEYDDVLELGDESEDGIIEIEAALLVQHHHRDCGDRSRHRVNTKERSLRHRHARLQILHADGFEVAHSPASGYRGHRTRNSLLRDIPVQEIGCLAEAY